ncbi:MAG: prenyltransferase/squalene oxidase repeat-containing protein [Bacillaceae bacterium]
MNQTDLKEEITRRVEELIGMQKEDGTWRFCFESAILTDVYFVLLCQVLGYKEKDIITGIVSKLLERQAKSGGWKMHEDEEEGDLSTTIQAYVAICASGLLFHQDERLKKAEQFILRKGGLKSADFLTKFLLCLHNLYAYPHYIYIPTTIFLLKPSMLFSMYDFSNYARVHLTPMIILANKRKNFPIDTVPTIIHLLGERRAASSDERFEQRFELKEIMQTLTNYAPLHHFNGYKAAEKFMLERIEENGTLYSYATSTYYMIYALLSLGYDQNHPVIQKAFHGLKSLYNPTYRHIENSPSTIWDTGLLSYAMQEAGVSHRHSSIKKANAYLLSKQHQKEGDWKIHAPLAYPGGWGFSPINTIVPDNDDTSVVLRAIYAQSLEVYTYETAFNRGIEWLLSMQNDDGGWAAFEKNTNNELFTHLPIEYAKEALIDPSTPDLTGRALEFLGTYAGFHYENPTIEKAVYWGLKNQEDDGSWYGKWGVCYIYGTWAMLTGLQAVGYRGKEIDKGCQWLLSIQNDDGGWGESCFSSTKKKYVSLPFSTPSQSAWALDALIHCGYHQHEKVKKGIAYLVNYHSKAEKTYPTGIGLAGSFYTYYHSYNYIYPLLALAHYFNRLKADVEN